MDTQEKDLVPAVVDLLKREGYDLVLSGVRSSDGFDGKGEFPIVSQSTGRIRYADVVAIRWSGGHVQTVAVECKRTADKVYDALGQAVEYQSLFDEVYIATPLDIEHKELIRSTLVDLGLGHIRTGETPSVAEVTVAPTPRWPARFLPHKRRAVDGRLALGLAVRKIAEHPHKIRYGFYPQTDGGPQGIWCAEEVVGHLQWNSWHETSVTGADEAGAGINVERAEDVRRIAHNLDPVSLDRALSALNENYVVRVIYAPNPRHYGAKDEVVLHEQAIQTSASETRSLLLAPPKGKRPQLQVFRLLDSTELRAVAQWHSTLDAVRTDLQSVMAVLRTAGS